MSEKTEAPADVPPMTLRQYAAIHLRVPESGEEWLDAMIQAARLMDNQQAALSGAAVAPSDHTVQHAENLGFELFKEQSL